MKQPKLKKRIVFRGIKLQLFEPSGGKPVYGPCASQRKALNADGWWVRCERNSDGCWTADVSYTGNQNPKVLGIVNTIGYAATPEVALKELEKHLSGRLDRLIEDHQDSVKELKRLKKLSRAKDWIK